MPDAINESKTLYLFIDESGNFDFSAKGTKYFMVTALATFDPVIKREELVQLRYALLEDGMDQEYFHASEDRQVVRDSVYKILASMQESYEIHAVIAEKNLAHPSLYKETYTKKNKIIERNTGTVLYQKICQTVLKYVCKGKEGEVEKVVIVLGSLFQGDKKKAILKTLKQYLKTHFPGIPFEIFSHANAADLNCQLADYCCWAISAKWERAEMRSYKIIEKNIKNEFPLFRRGRTKYY
jgi:hypothetical protein